MEEVEGLEEIATVGQKTIGWGTSENGPLIIAFDGDNRILKSNPITLWGARKEYEKLLVYFLEEENRSV